MRQAENIHSVAAMYPDFLGFIFYKKSPRYIDNTTLKNALDKLHKKIKTVAVFVNEDVDEMSRICKKYNFSHAQLHGQETPEECRALINQGLKVIKAIPVSQKINMTNLEPYEEHVDFFLFDTKTPNHGGSGEQFNWDILQSYSGSTPYFLSGGIGAADISKVKELDLQGLIGIDANSRLEIEPGMKNLDETKKLIDQIKEL